MIYLDIGDEIERKNIKNVVTEFNEKDILTEKNPFETEQETENKIKKSKIVICDDNFEIINKYLSKDGTAITYSDFDQEEINKLFHVFSPFYLI